VFSVVLLKGKRGQKQQTMKGMLMTDQTNGRGVQKGNPADFAALFDRQAKTLIEKGFHAAAGISETAFEIHLSRLRASTLGQIDAVGPENLPFAIVIPECLVAIPTQLALMNGSGRMAKMDVRGVRAAEDAEEFRVPYAIIDIEPGKATKGQPPIALQTHKNGRRYGLSLVEGVALQRYFGVIQKDHAISLPGSCCGFDLHPILFLEKGSHLKLGFCQAGQGRQDCGPVSCVERIAPR